MIKNYTSNSKQTFDAIQKCLIQHKAQQIMFEYTEDGKVKSLNFALSVGGRIVGFRLPARVEKVEKVFREQGIPVRDPDQPYRTAWANIRDWITAQMALIDTEQVKIEEVFLPYALQGDKTYFEVIEAKRFELGEGKE